jgi:uncharacterized protein YggU (UPF0235/DUF167 family)
VIALEAHAEGTILPVQARAAARRNALKEAPDGSLHVSVTQAPEKGKANKAIVALLAETLSLRKSQIEVLAGATSSQKRLLVRGITPAELAARIASAL